jgi:hypothetical protein
MTIPSSKLSEFCKVENWANKNSNIYLIYNDRIHIQQISQKLLQTSNNISYTLRCILTENYIPD